MIGSDSLSLSRRLQEFAGQDFRPERRVRHVHLLYHLEDDTISIIEPRVKV